MNEWLAEEKFESKEDVIIKTEAYFEDLPKSYILDGYKKSGNRREECIELQEVYVEKQK